MLAVQSRGETVAELNRTEGPESGELILAIKDK